MHITPKPAIAQLVHALNHLHPLSEPVIDFLNNNVEARRYEKGELLLRSGDICQSVFFIKQGLIRGYINDTGKDITTWISCENELVTSISSLDRNVPALENIETIEYCELLVMPTKALQELYVLHPEFNIVGRKILQSYYRDAEVRAFITRVTKAEDKYENFLNLYSHLSNRVLLKYIASFLGITLETLSRVRSRNANKKNDLLIV